MGKFSPVPEWVTSTSDAFNHEAHNAHLDAVKHDKVVRVLALNFATNTNTSKAFRTVGRKADKCDIVLDNNSVSREHAVLALGVDERDVQALFVFDLGSAQGTRLNADYLESNKRYRLKSGDKLKFGVSSTEYVVRFGNADGTEMPMAPPSIVSEHEQQQDSVHMPPPAFSSPKTKSHGRLEPQEDTAAAAKNSSSFSSSKKTTKAEKEKDKEKERAEREAEIEAMTLSLSGPIPQPSANISDNNINMAMNGHPNVKQEQLDEPEQRQPQQYIAPAPNPMSAEERLSLASRALLVPLTHQVELKGHNKTVTALSVDHGGARVVSGGLDYTVRLWDFGGMDKHHRSFRSLTPLDGTVINSISHSPDGKSFVVAPAASQLMIYNREAALQFATAKGDVYIHDMSNTKGHVGAVTGTVWHPSDLNIFASCGLDGTCRLWDINGKTTVMGGDLKSRDVLKGRDRRNARVSLLCCDFDAQGARVAAGAADGSLQMWKVKTSGRYVRPDMVIRPAHDAAGAEVSGVAFSPDGTLLASRAANDDCVKVWDLRKTDRPLFCFADLPNRVPQTNLTFSANGSLLVTGTSAMERAGKDNDGEENFKTGGGELVVMRLRGPSGLVRSFGSTTKAKKAHDVLIGEEEDESDKPVLRTPVCPGGAVVRVLWHHKINQLLLSCSDGVIRTLYNPEQSNKGALLSASKSSTTQRRDFVSSLDFISENDPNSIDQSNIMNPNALHMYRDEDRSVSKRKLDEQALRQDPIATKRPSLPSNAGGGKSRLLVHEQDAKKGLVAPLGVGNTMYTDMLRASLSGADTGPSDPREALLAYADRAKADGRWVNNAYKDTQPTTQLHTQTLEQEELAAKRQTTDLSEYDRANEDK